MDDAQNADHSGCHPIEYDVLVGHMPTDVFPTIGQETAQFGELGECQHPLRQGAFVFLTLLPTIVFSVY